MTLPAGSVVAYVEQIIDTFGRRWSVVGDPFTVRLRHDDYLAPFSAAQFRAFHGVAAFLPAESLASVESEAPVAAGSAAEEKRKHATPPWWTTTVDLDDRYQPEFGGPVGIGARTMPEAVARRAVNLLGGREALGPWPQEPLPGQLHVPGILPLVFQWDGVEWGLMLPVKLLASSLGLLGNPDLQVMASAPVTPSGPAVPCWQVVGALDARGGQVGKVTAAPAPLAPSASSASGRPDRNGWRDLTLLVWPAAGLKQSVPPRWMSPKAGGGVEVGDNSHRQAVYLQQQLGPQISRRLRGQEVILDVWARSPSATGGSATIGLVLEAGGQRVASSGVVGGESTLVSLSITLPQDAENLRVRLLPLDASIAVQEQGDVIFERATLRPASWALNLPPATLLLQRVSASSYEGVPRFTRAPLAVSERPIDEIREVWQQLAANGWSEEDQRLMLAGAVRAGMSPEQVKLSWGEPMATTETVSLPGMDERWDYADRSAVFIDSHLASWSVEGTSSAPPVAPSCPGVTLDSLQDRNASR